MAKRKNELDIALKEELLDLGVSVDKNIEDINLKGKRIFKIDDELLTQYDQLFKLIPQACLNSYNGKVFRAHFDEGLGVLQKAVGEEGYFRGNVVGARGKFVQNVKWEKLSSAPQIIGGIFTVMSIATGQYYLAEINKSLKKIDREVHQVYQFLENDKKSRLIANEEFLKGIQANIESISNNSAQQIATINTLQEISRSASADMSFYQMQMENVYAKYNDITKAEEVVNINQELGQYIFQQWYSLYIYCFSLYLEPIVAKNNDREYLHYVMEKMASSFKEFRDAFNLFQDKIKYFISNTKGFEPNQILSSANKVLKNTSKAVLFSPASRIKIATTVASLAVEIAEGHDKDVSKKRKLNAENIPEISQINKEFNTVDLFRKQLSLYDSLYNSELDLVRTEEALYIKY